MIKALILIDYSTEFSRRFLNGLIQWAHEVGEWTFYRLPPYYESIYREEEVIEWANKWDANVIIAQWNYMGIELLKKLQRPVFLQNYEEEGKVFSNIIGDYVGTGVMAAKFFIQRRYKNFAFYGNKGYIWSAERAQGFMNEIKKKQENYYYFESEDLNHKQWGHSHIELENWLISLPKPIAIFACDDSFAIQIAEICKLNNIHIPDEVALLGVDNDMLTCNLSDPPISSIVLDSESGGYRLGKKIQEVLTEKKCDLFNITINPLCIELRKSTEKYLLKDGYILKVIKYIQENFKSKIDVDVLTKLVPLSRRSLEIRFRQEMGMPIYQFIIDLRIEYFTLLLMTTDLPIPDIVFKSGFNDYSNVIRIFKKMKGCTPKEYRNKSGCCRVID